MSSSTVPRPLGLSTITGNVPGDMMAGVPEPQPPSWIPQPRLLRPGSIGTETVNRTCDTEGRLGVIVISTVPNAFCRVVVTATPELPCVGLRFAVHRCDDSMIAAALPASESGEGVTAGAVAHAAAPAEKKAAAIVRIEVIFTCGKLLEGGQHQ
jgi:hypothetical protein